MDGVCVCVFVCDVISMQGHGESVLPCWRLLLSPSLMSSPRSLLTCPAVKICCSPLLWAVCVCVWVVVCVCVCMGGVYVCAFVCMGGVCAGLDGVCVCMGCVVCFCVSVYVCMCACLNGVCVCVCVGEGSGGRRLHTRGGSL